MSVSPSSPDNRLNERAREESLFIARETSAYLTNTARSTTTANVLAPLLAYALFIDDVVPWKFAVWLSYMVVATAIRTWKANPLETDPALIVDPHRNLRITTFSVGLIGVGWGLGWVLLTPDLTMVNRLIYLFVTTGAMFSGVFGFGVHWPAFYALTIPIFVPAIATAFWPAHGFPWPFAVGIATLFVYVLRISRKFSQTYADSLRLRLRNETLYQDLAAERDASVAANVAKSRFIAAASHDLRQPMHAVNFYLESMALSRLPEPVAQVIGKIHRSVTNLNQMFESLLDVSKLDAFTYQAVREPFPVAGLLRSLDEAGAPLAASQGVGFAVHDTLQAGQGAGSGWLVGDEKLLRQILQNLITNAVYYTPAGRVDVRLLRSDDGMLVVEVQDTGCGIRREDLGLIFTEFYRVSETRSRHDGLGLGLSIVKRLCDLIEARIDVESEVGVGSTFRVRTRYPLSEQPPARDALRDGAAGLPGQPVSLAGLTVAVVEDDANIVEAYRQALSQRGARVIALPEGGVDLAQALEELNSIDLIISDFRLAQVTGDSVIQQLRENFNRDIPAIIVTADTSPAHIGYFKALNIPVLHKPISFQRVIETVEQVLEASRRP